MCELIDNSILTSLVLLHFCQSRLLYNHNYVTYTYTCTYLYVYLYTYKHIKPLTLLIIKPLTLLILSVIDNKI